ncbi:hypothetical protein [Methanoplanus limicola]|uniref:Uncharacterized protein n=1 Tax=Methanoplanus limicola DSM 2279 TaxID=937775 RepID=H1Z2L2_9EURY|nr:hypothetical protein [Methanoplanus limicola]EHQ36415.1 hypothetical protein Metlim_2362 [Methanoplanus limicola DSM 2279]
MKKIIYGKNGPKYATAAILMFILIISPSIAAEVLTIDPVAVPQKPGGGIIELSGTSSLSPGTELTWLFANENSLIADSYPDSMDWQYEKKGTTNVFRGDENSRWIVQLDTKELIPGYYSFGITGNEALAERIIIFDNESRVADNQKLSEISPDIDYYASPNSKFVPDRSSELLSEMIEIFDCDMPSGHISSEEPVVIGNNINIDFFTIPARSAGLWLYSAFPDCNYRYFTYTGSDSYCGRCTISFNREVTSGLTPGDYYIFVEISGRHRSDLFNGDEDEYYDYLTTTPEPGDIRDWSDPKEQIIESPRSSVALEEILKANEEESKFMRFKIKVIEPWISLDDTGDLFSGEDILVSGRTNFEEKTVLTAEILPTGDNPIQKDGVLIRDIEVKIDEFGDKRFQTLFDSSAIVPGEYIIRVSDRDYRLAEDNAVIEVIDNIYNREEKEEETLIVKSYSVDPVSKTVVKLNEPAKKSPLLPVTILTGIVCIFIVLYSATLRRKRR